MSTKNFRSVRLLPKPASELNILTGDSGEVFFDSTNQSLRVYNGVSTNGIQLLRSDLANLSTTGGTNVNFGTKVLQAAGFSGPLTGAVTGNVTGNVTGTVSSISNHALNELSDVSVGSVQNGQVLYYNGSSNQWQPTTLSSSFNGGTITTALAINDSTVSSTYGTGALVVQGGLGVGGAINAGGAIAGTSITVNSATINGTIANVTTATIQTLTASTEVNVQNRGSVKLYTTGNTKFLGIKPPAVITNSYTWTLPDGDGTANQVLQTDGAGNLGWVNLPTGGGSGGVSNPPGGAAGYIQYNGGSNTFAGSINLRWVSATSTVTTVNVLASGDISAATLTGSLTGDVTSTNATITGGSINGTPVGSSSRSSGGFTSLAASSTVTFDDATNASSTTSASVVVAGGIGVAQDAIIGGSVTVNNSLSVANDIEAQANVVVLTKPTLPTHVTNKKYVDSKALALSIALGG